MKVITSDKVIYTFKPDMEPIQKILPNEIVEVETNDCFLNQIKNEKQIIDEIDFSKVNPATGPIYIEGAEAGDTLKIEILNIDLPDKGVMIIAPNEGVLGNFVKHAQTRVVKIENKVCHFGDISIPARPMIGVIGVAPSQKDGEYPTGTPWKHGGNMDTIDITEGAALYLPVNQKGALLALGDCHAVMGDGEVCVTGCEIKSRVRLKTILIKDISLEWPIVETNNFLAIIASGNTVEEAAKEATRCAVDLLSNGLKLDWSDAYMLASLVVDIKVSQVVDPKKTVRASISKGILSPKKIF